MVSTWRMIRSTVFVSALVASVGPAQTCLLPYIHMVGCFTAPALHLCSNNDPSNSARNITCAGTGADRRECILTRRDAPFRVVTVEAGVKTVSAP